MCRTWPDIHSLEFDSWKVLLRQAMRKNPLLDGLPSIALSLKTSPPSQSLWRASFAPTRQNVSAQSEGWWSRRVTLPHQFACRASALLVCHDPGRISPNTEIRKPIPRCDSGFEFLLDFDFRNSDLKLAGRLGAAPSKLSVGDSVAQAGARPVVKIVNRKS